MHDILVSGAIARRLSAELRRAVGMRQVWSDICGRQTPATTPQSSSTILCEASTRLLEAHSVRSTQVLPVNQPTEPCADIWSASGRYLTISYLEELTTDPLMRLSCQACLRTIWRKWSFFRLHLPWHRTWPFSVYVRPISRISSMVAIRITDCDILFMIGQLGRGSVWLGSRI